MTQARRWLPFPSLIVAALLLFILLIPQRPSTPVGEFVLPERSSGRPVQALYHVQAIAAQEGWTAERLRLAGGLWREAGDLQQALTYWQAAAQDGADDSMLRDIAQTAIELQDWASASDALQRLVTRHPDDPWVNLQLGLLQVVVNPSHALGFLSLAANERGYAPLVADLIEALDRSQNDPASGLAVGQVLADHELWSFAELAFTQAATQQAMPDAMAYAAFVRDRQGKDGTAWIERALRLAPDSPTVFLLYGLHLRGIGDYGASLDALVRAVVLDPENPVLYAELGVAYQLAGDYTQARRWLEQAVGLSDDPRFQQLLDALSVEENQVLEAFAIVTEETGEADAATAEPVP
jgi:tetratricopeptide (TPR) repeat protein